MFDGVGVGVDCLQQDGGCKCIVVGGDQMSSLKISNGIYFMFTNITRP
jgi:hypothetical protein